MTVYFVMLLASGYIRKIGRISSIFFGYHISWKVKIMFLDGFSEKKLSVSNVKKNEMRLYTKDWICIW